MNEIFNIFFISIFYTYKNCVRGKTDHYISDFQIFLRIYGHFCKSIIFIFIKNLLSNDQIIIVNFYFFQ
jgi:hypothetical protein